MHRVSISRIQEPKKPNTQTDTVSSAEQHVHLRNNKTNGRFMIIAVFMTNYRGILCILSTLEIGCVTSQHLPNRE